MMLLEKYSMIDSLNNVLYSSKKACFPLMPKGQIQIIPRYS
jgi:hypothetical protein